MQIRNAAVRPGVGVRHSMVLVFLVALAAGHPVGTSAADKQKTLPTLYRHTARTAGPALKRGGVKAAGIEWTCRDKVCTASGPWPATGVKACQALAREVGRIVEFGQAGAKLAAPDLERCNQFLPAAGLPATKVKQPAPTAGGAAAEAVAPARTSVPAGLRSHRAQPPPVAGRKAARPMTLAKGLPLLPAEGDAGGDNRSGGQEGNQFLENPWVLAGIGQSAGNRRGAL
ncbi:MAG: CC_3452 family protein [Candidatus Geothermincolia bacterium]